MSRVQSHIIAAAIRLRKPEPGDKLTMGSLREHQDRLRHVRWTSERGGTALNIWVQAPASEFVHVLNAIRCETAADPKDPETGAVDLTVLARGDDASTIDTSTVSVLVGIQRSYEGPAAGKSSFGGLSRPSGLLLDWLTPPSYADEATSNICARYDHWVEKHGRRWATIIFHTQCIGAIVSCWTEWVMKRLKLLTLMKPSQ